MGRKRTHCKRGHPLDGDNVYVSPDGKRRRCRECIRQYSREQAEARERDPQAKRRYLDAIQRWRDAHPDEVREHRRRYRARNLERARASAREYARRQRQRRV